MDFDALLPAWQHVGLTYPGIGEDKYLEMAMPLYDLLETLLPSDDPIVKRVITTLSGKSQDGFQLYVKLWACLYQFSAHTSQANLPFGASIQT